MTLRTRKSIYYTFLALFLLVGAYLVMVTQGLVLDLAKFRIVKTGGIYLRTLPADAAILVNKEPYRSESGILSRGTLVNNLLPDTYHVEVSAPGYRTWQKDLTVENGLVASASNVFLWKERYAETPVATSSVADFFLTGKGLVLENDEGILSLDATPLKGASVVASSPASPNIVTKDAKGNFLFTDLRNLKSSTNVTSLFASLYRRSFAATSTPSIVDVALHPWSADRIVVAASDGIYLLDLKKVQLERSAALPDTEHLVVTVNEVFGGDGKGAFSGTNLMIGSPIAFSLATTSVATVRTNPSGTKFFVLDKRGALMEYDRSAATSTLIASGVKDFALGPDEERILLVGKDNRIRVHYLAETTGDFRVDEGSSTSVTVPNVLKSAIVTTAWLPEIPDQFLVGVNSDLFAAETDPRTPENTALLFSHIKKYALSGDVLYLLRNDGSLSTVTLL